MKIICLNTNHSKTSISTNSTYENIESGQKLSVFTQLVPAKKLSGLGKNKIGF